ITIPNSVTSIGGFAFSGCTGLKTVTIPESVTSIGSSAFYGCNRLTSVTIPNSVTSIGYATFDGCRGLTSVTIPNSVTSIGNSAFYGCSGLTSVTIPNSVTSIGSWAFNGCSGLTSVTIGNSVTSIGEEAFQFCFALTSVTIPESVESIGDDAFDGCEIKTSLIIESDADLSNVGLNIVVDNIYYHVLTKNTVERRGSTGDFESSDVPDDYVMPETVTCGSTFTVKSIGSRAFENICCNSITVPNNIETIANDAFCRSTNYIIYSGTATGAPWGARALVAIIDENGFVYSDNEKTQLVGYFGNNQNITIPNTVSNIGNYAFSGKNLKSLTIPESVVSIGGDAFYGCKVDTLTYNTNVVGTIFSGMLSLKTVNIGDAVTVIADNAFANCGSLTTVTIPESVTSIGEGAFDRCVRIESLTYNTNAVGTQFSGKSLLKTINIGNAVTEIADYAFGGCDHLTSITIPNSVTNIGKNAFANCSSVETLTYNTNAVSGSLFGHMQSLKTVNIGDAVTRIDDGAFNGRRSLTSVTIGNSVASIGNNAFSGCSLTSITIPESVASIGNNAFNGNNMSSITIESDADVSKAGLSFTKDGVRYNVLSTNAVKLISGTNNSTEVVIPATVEAGSIFSITSIEDYAFKNCANLTSVIINIDADVSKAGLSFTKDGISYDVLSRSTAKLTNGARFSGDLVLPEKVTAGNTFTITGIGDYAFAGNSSLTSVTLPEWVTNIGRGAFTGCNNIETLTYNTDAVGALFRGLLSLKTVNIGDAVTRLESGAFAGCENLEQVSVGNGIESIGDNVFAGCESLDYNIYSNGYYLGNSQNPNMILMSARNMNITSCTVSGDCRFICDGAFRDCKKLAEVVLPESLTRVNNGLFAGCSSLRSVVIPESVTAIGDESFKGCSSLTEIKIPVSVTTIGSSAFEGCSGLSALTIPDGVISVSNNAFDGCTGLEAVVIGKSVAEFSSGIFANCNGLKSIICHAETPIKLKGDPFLFNDTIYVPAASVDAYKAATVWKRKDIMPFYKVKILSANEALGTAEGDTLILGDHAATLTTTPAEGYHFVRWSDNNTESPRAFAATKDTVLTAYFEAHTTVTDLAVAVTCEAFGLTEGSHCPGCGHVFVKQDTLPATGHTEVVDAAVPVTCTTAGKTEGKHCSVCHEVLTAQEVIAATGHQVVVDLAVPATCTVTGWTDGKHCSVCNAVLVEQKEVPAFGHEFGAYVYNNDATTELDGTETALCKHGCGASVSRVAVGTKLSETPGEGSSTAVEESAADEVSIYAHHNVIVVENADAEIRVYDAMGRLIVETPHCDVSTEIRMNTAGIYIVRVGSVVKRVMVNE
ncbi:MAG: leucine-rich repeat domain-containing protein, partial [Salinivirgaceae bacterium]|nr:leucine-rich repeat domain-containing protein [Salinivirgaceae bacterium]